MWKTFVHLSLLAALFVAVPCAYGYTSATDITKTVKSSGGDYSSLDAALEVWADGDNTSLDNDRCIYTGAPPDPRATFNPTGTGTTSQVDKCPQSESDIPAALQATYDHTDWTLYSGELWIEMYAFEDVQAAIPDYVNGFHNDWESDGRIVHVIGHDDLTLGKYDTSKWRIYYDWTGTALYLVSRDLRVEAENIQVRLNRPENNDNTVSLMTFGRQSYATGGNGGGWHLHHAYLELALDSLESPGIDRGGLAVEGSYSNSSSDTYHTLVENVLVATITGSERGKTAVALNTKKFKMYNVTVGGPWDNGFYFGLGFDSNTSQFRNNLVGPEIYLTDRSFWVPYGCTNWSSAVDYIATASDTSFPCTTSNGQICDPSTNALVFVNDGVDWSLDSTDQCAIDNGQCLDSMFTDDADHDTRPDCESGDWDIGMDEEG